MNIPLQAYWDLLYQHVRPQRWRFTLLMALMLANIGLQVVNPQIMRSFIDSALGGAPLAGLALAAVAFITIAIVQQMVSVILTYQGENLAWSATNALRAELAEHCLNLDLAFHNAHTPGELIERIDGDVNELATFFSQFFITLIGNLLLLVGILAVLFFEEWRAGLAFTIFALVSLVLLNQVRDIAIPHQKARRQAEAELFGFVEEQLSGTEDIRANGAVGFVLRQLALLQAKVFRADYAAHQKGWIIHNTIGAALLIGDLLAIVSGYFLFKAGAVTLGTVYLFIRYMNLLETPINALTRQVESFQTIGACVERLGELRRMKSSVVEGQLSELPGRVEGPTENSQALRLDLSNVTFAYADGDGSPVLQDLSFHLQPGAVLGVLGRTGSGKTTLSRLLLRLFDPLAGQVNLNGVDLRQLKLDALRRQVAVVTQDVQLFRATVRQNLTFFDASIPDERIKAAIYELELGDWFNALPQGLDTLLEEGGAGLSAGEAQLLAFTRVLLRSPGLVILDEASSRLDPFTERRIERAIDRLLSGRTALIIAHRLGTVQRADEILILEKGSVLECGSRLALAADLNSRFYSLLQTGLEEVLV